MQEIREFGTCGLYEKSSQTIQFDYVAHMNNLTQQRLYTYHVEGRKDLVGCLSFIFSDFYHIIAWGLVCWVGFEVKILTFLSVLVLDPWGTLP